MSLRSHSAWGPSSSVGGRSLIPRRGGLAAITRRRHRLGRRRRTLDGLGPRPRILRGEGTKLLLDWRGIAEGIWTLQDSVGPIATQHRHQTATTIDLVQLLSPRGLAVTRAYAWATALWLVEMVATGAAVSFRLLSTAVGLQAPRRDSGGERDDAVAVVCGVWSARRGLGVWRRSARFVRGRARHILLTRGGIAATSRVETGRIH